MFHITDGGIFSVILFEDKDKVNVPNVLLVIMERDTVVL